MVSMGQVAQLEPPESKTEECTSSCKMIQAPKLSTIFNGCLLLCLAHPVSSAVQLEHWEVLIERFFPHAFCL